MKEIDFFDLKLCEKIGAMFEYAVFHEGYDAYAFTKAWLGSDTFSGILEWDVALVSQARTYILGKFLDELTEGGIVLERKPCEEAPECIYWLGYVFTYWGILEEMQGAEMMQSYQIDRIIDNAFAYHTLSVKTAICMIKEEMKK